MKRKDANNIGSFIDSYEKTNFISRWLFGNFFSCIQSMIPRGANSIFEIGCGGGYSSQKIKEFTGDKFVGACDVNDDLLEIAKRKNPGIIFSRESIYEMSQSDSSFDLIVCLEVLEHLDDPEKAIIELERVTARYVLLSVPREPLWRFLNVARGSFLADWGNTPGHLNHWSKKSFVCLVEKYFEIKKVASPLPWTVILAEKKI